MIRTAFWILMVLILYQSRKHHWSILLCGLLLILYGLGAVYSVSIYDSFTLGLRQIAKGLNVEPSNYFYFLRQVRNIVTGLIVSFGIYRIPIRFFQKEKNIIILFVLFVLFQLLVFIPGIGITLHGARGWISLPGLTTLQPAEFFKIGYVFFMASRLIRKHTQINTKEFFLKFITINSIIFSIFVLIPDLGTVLVMALTGLILCRYKGAKLKYVILIGISGIIIGLLGGLVASSVSNRFAYITNRFLYFMKSDIDPQKRGIGRQNQQALIAIGGGGLRGQGYGKGLQKFGFIPEAQSDFIFSAFSEEIGLVGNMLLLSLYFYLCWYFLNHLPAVKDEYSKLIGIGIISLIIMQMFVNIGVNLKLLPNTGLTLPFISHGGSAILVNMIQVILLYKILTNR